MHLLKRELLRVIPISLVAGAAIELFMIKTGFYEVATRLEGERRAERALQEKEAAQRMKELRIKFDLSKKDT